MIEWSPPSTMGMAPVRATSSTRATDDGVAALEAAGHDGHVPAVDDVEPVERVHPGLE